MIIHTNIIGNIKPSNIEIYNNGKYKVVNLYEYKFLKGKPEKILLYRYYIVYNLDHCIIKGLQLSLKIWELDTIT